MLNRPIYDITPFTALDYPDRLSAIVWFSGCNMRCGYCYNTDIVLKGGKLTFIDALEFLKTRTNLLDGVVLSGGEATTIKDLTYFTKEVKRLGFLVKLDTNGSNPKLLRSLLKENLLDYVAMDFKGVKEKFLKITKLDAYENFLSCLELLQNSQIEFEIRTTYHHRLLNEQDLNNMIDVLYRNGYNTTFYIQLAREEKTFQDLGPSKKIDKSILKSLIPLEFR